jgi:hypothetical protein
MLILHYSLQRDGRQHDRRPASAPCGSGKTQAFLKLVGTLPRGLVRVLALQIRCSLVSQLCTQLVERSVRPVLYNNGDVSAKCDDDNDDDCELGWGQPVTPVIRSGGHHPDSTKG